jgi:RHS repeat-associated protein
MDITGEGHVNVYVSAQNDQDVDIYFDDLKVTHYRSKVVTQTTDYYPFGSVLRTAKTNEDTHYRFGFQGEFSEEDEETGWNSFELRMLDTKIARWLSPDPYNEFWSPYVGWVTTP